MDANEQPRTAGSSDAGSAEAGFAAAGSSEPRPTYPGTSATRPSDPSPAPADSASAEREAACRANHPSRWQPREDRTTSPGAAAAAHYEAAAVRWLVSQRPAFDAWPEDAEERSVTLGALADLAQLVGARLRRDPDDLSEDYRTLLSTLTSVAARADSRALLCDDPRALLPLVAVQGCLRAAWLEDAGLGHALDRTLGDRSVVGLASTPAEQIVAHSLLAQAGLDLPCPQLPVLMATSLLADDACGVDWDAARMREASSIIIAVTSLGASAVPWPAGATTEGVAGLVQEWLVLAMADEDAGLVGDLLAALDCMRTSGTEFVEAAHRWLHGWQESDGRVDPSATSGSSADVHRWAAAMHATSMTALVGLLTRTPAQARQHRPAATPSAAPTAAVAQAGLVEAVMSAADWLDAVLPGTHVAGRLWTSEAWLALGDEEEARRQLVRLSDDPHLAFTVLKESSDLAVHLAALVVALGVTSAPLADLCDDVAALLTHPEAAHELLGAARERARLVSDDDAVPLPADAAALRHRSRELCARLLRDGAHTDPRSAAGLDELLLLARAARAGSRVRDLGWLALSLRGLHRMPLAPARLVSDVARTLRGQQRADGALCERPSDVRPGVGDRQVRWTLQALTALVEELPRSSLPEAA